MKRRLIMWWPASAGRHGGTISTQLFSSLSLKLIQAAPAPSVDLGVGWALLWSEVARNMYLSRSISMTLPLRSCSCYQSQMWTHPVSRAVAQPSSLAMCHCWSFILYFADSPAVTFILLSHQLQVLTAYFPWPQYLRSLLWPLEFSGLTL